MAVAADADEYVSDDLDFTKETTFRKHKIVCGEKTFYVSGVCLAEKSPYFHKAFYGGLTESESNTFSCPNEDPKNVITYLEAVYGVIDVSAENCALLIRFSDMWYTPLIRSKCRDVLHGWLHLSHSESTCERTIAALEAALLYGLRYHIKELLLCLMQFDNDELTKCRFVERIDDRYIIAAVQELCIWRMKREWGEHHHKTQYRSQCCDVSSCRSIYGKGCSGCEQFYCSAHDHIFEKTLCPKPNIEIPYLDKIIPVEGDTEK